MPYSDRWGISITKISPGVYQVSRGQQSGIVRIGQVFSDETANDAAALFQAIEQIESALPPLWAARRRYALSQWKVRAYQILIDNSAPGQTRTALRNKRDVWVSEELRMRNELGADA
jgi:hypothetical protein